MLIMPALMTFLITLLFLRSLLSLQDRFCFVITLTYKPSSTAISKSTSSVAARERAYSFSVRSDGGHQFGCDNSIERPRQPIFSLMWSIMDSAVNAVLPV